MADTSAKIIHYLCKLLFSPVQFPEHEADEPGDEEEQRQDDVGSLKPKSEESIPIIAFLDNAIGHMREDFPHIINSINHQRNDGGKGMFERDFIRLFKAQKRDDAQHRVDQMEKEITFGKQGNG